MIKSFERVFQGSSKEKSKPTRPPRRRDTYLAPSTTSMEPPHTQSSFAPSFISPPRSRPPGDGERQISGTTSTGSPKPSPQLPRSKPVPARPPRRDLAASESLPLPSRSSSIASIPCRRRPQSPSATAKAQPRHLAKPTASAQSNLSTPPRVLTQKQSPLSPSPPLNKDKSLVSTKDLTSSPMGPRVPPEKRQDLRASRSERPCRPSRPGSKHPPIATSVARPSRVKPPDRNPSDHSKVAKSLAFSPPVPRRSSPACSEPKEPISGSSKPSPNTAEVKSGSKAVFNSPSRSDSSVISSKPSPTKPPVGKTKPLQRVLSSPLSQSTGSLPMRARVKSGDVSSGDDVTASDPRNVKQVPSSRPRPAAAKGGVKLLPTIKG